LNGWPVLLLSLLVSYDESTTRNCKDCSAKLEERERERGQ